MKRAPLHQFRVSCLLRPTYDPRAGIPLLIPAPDFKQMADVSIDDMAEDAWIFPKVVDLRPPVAVATIRSKTADCFQFVTRVRSTYSKFHIHPAMFVTEKFFLCFLIPYYTIT